MALIRWMRPASVAFLGATVLLASSAYATGPRLTSRPVAVPNTAGSEAATARTGGASSKLPRGYVQPTPIRLPGGRSPRAIAFLINGFTGCCIPERVRDYLDNNEVVVIEGNWNDLTKQGNPGNIDPTSHEVVGAVPRSDEHFIRQMRDTIATFPETLPIVLIGHSFGADALLQVASRIGTRRICVLAILDAVGRGGLRVNVTSPVPSNVDYFFNRWQTNSHLAFEGLNFTQNIVPFDNLLSGRLTSKARYDDQGRQNTERSKRCKVKYRDPFKAIPQLLSHHELPNDGCIQSKLIRVLSAQLSLPRQ